MIAAWHVRVRRYGVSVSWVRHRHREVHVVRCDPCHAVGIFLFRLTDRCEDFAMFENPVASCAETDLVEYGVVASVESGDRTVTHPHCTPCTHTPWPYGIALHKVTRRILVRYYGCRGRP